MTEQNSTTPTQAEINAALQKGLTQEQQDVLRNARVAVVGLGGLGSNIAVALTRLSISQLYLYDFDKVELSNLNRQYYFLDDIGQYKADALVKHLRQINPYADLHAQVVKVTAENIPTLLGSCDIICEALDDASGKAMLVSTVLSTWSDKKLVAASGIAGFGKAEEIISKKSITAFIFAATAAAIFMTCRSAEHALLCAPISRHCSSHALF